MTTDIKSRWLGKLTQMERLQPETSFELDALLPAILDKVFKREL